MIGDFFPVFPLPQVRDLIDICVIAFIIYHALLLVRGTRGWQVTLGLTSLISFYYLTRFFELRTVEWLFGNLSILGHPHKS